MDNKKSTRLDRSLALLVDGDARLLRRFSLLNLPFRYLALEIDDLGMIEEMQNAETLPEIVRLLEGSSVEGTDTEIHDLETGDVLMPDFKRIYRIQRIFLDKQIVYERADRSVE